MKALDHTRAIAALMVEGYSYVQIAERVGLRLGQVKTRVATIRAVLAEHTGDAAWLGKNTTNVQTGRAFLEAGLGQ
ncbi:MAG: hypothetical protein R3B09_26360 [Nannocystaceae bacterium]